MPVVAIDSWPKLLKTGYRIENDACTEILEKLLTQLDDSIDVVLFPAGFYITEKPARSLYKQTTMTVQKILKSVNKQCMVCLGIDGRYGKDQIALAIDNSGIIALGRKFNPTDDEKGQIKSAENYLSNEDKHSRIFKIRNKRFYLAVCYDSYGIRHKNLDNPGIEVVLNLVHKFCPRGEGGSGDVYFAKHGFAGASKQWGCDVFGVAKFIDREIPKNWPSGVYWNQGDKSTGQWKYEDNGIKPYDTILFDEKGANAQIRLYEIDM